MTNPHNHYGPKVYALRDPRNGALRYVGCTRRPLYDRLHAHVNEAMRRGGYCEKARWLLDLMADNYQRPEIVLLCEPDQQNARAAERRAICEHIAAGHALFNVHMRHEHTEREGER
jgi:Uri superfamily endonuclease